MKLKINGERRVGKGRECARIIEIGNNYHGPSDSSIAFRGKSGRKRKKKKKKQ